MTRQQVIVICVKKAMRFTWSKECKTSNLLTCFKYTTRFHEFKYVTVIKQPDVEEGEKIFYSDTFAFFFFAVDLIYRNSILSLTFHLPHILYGNNVKKIN